MNRCRRQERRLDHAGNARGGFEVPDARLHRPEVAWSPAPGGIGESVGERFDLDGITETRARAVDLDIADLGFADTRVAQRAADHRPLRKAVRRGQPVCRPVLVHRASPHEGNDRVVIAHGVGEPLQENDAAPFPPDEAVRPGRRRSCSVRRGP